MSEQINTSSRRLDIERAKGLAICLVVFGHIAARDLPAAWYEVAKNYIYTFHMPLFFYLSGYVFFLSRSHIKALAGYAGYTLKRADRLLLPFFAMAALIIAGKFAAGMVVDVDRPVSDLSAAISTLFYRTDSSPVVFIWYLFVLFTFAVITPILIKLVRGHVWLLVPVAALIHFVALPDVLYVDRAARDWVFFVIGAAAASSTDVWMHTLRRFRLAFVGVFAIASLAVCIFSLYPNARLVMGVLSILAIHGVFASPLAEKDIVFEWIGRYAFSVYLFNMIFVGVGKAVWSKLFGFSAVSFSIGAPFLFCFALFGPILLKKYILARIPLLDRYTS